MGSLKENEKERENAILHSLLCPLRLGPFNLSHRVVMAPMTRCRALMSVPQNAHVKYYDQRTTPGALLITEAVAVSPQGIGFPHSPGIFNQEQIDAWKEVVDVVHRRGGIIFCQIWHVGRASHTIYQPNGEPPVSSTSRRIPSKWLIRLPKEGEKDVYSEPRTLKTQEIPNIVEQFKIAARNAKLAGFDGVEIHAAHGYLIDQFFKDGINDRIDQYGGNIENRCRFGLEVISAVAQEIGSNRTGVRISPIIDHIGALDSNPIALGHYLVGKLNNLNLAYLHLTEPRFTSEGVKDYTLENCWEFRKAFKGIFMSSGGHTRESGMQAIESGYADLIAYGRLFISNPDLPIRFALESKLTNYNRSLFYTHDQVKGYIDYKPIDLNEDQEKEKNKDMKCFGSLGRSNEGSDLRSHGFYFQ